jgi:branched-chain amino acid aminotransferase
MILTRGVPRNGDRDPRNFENRFYAFAIPYVWLAKPELQMQGINLAIARGVQRTPSTSFDPTVKNFQWGDLVRGLFDAYDRDAYTTVLLDADGNVTEGPGFNVFVVHDGTLMTPPDGVLQGITRATVMELARRLGTRVVAQAFDAAFLRAADEVFITSTAGGVMPVSVVDGRAIGDGKPGALTSTLREHYWAAHIWPEWSEPVNYPRVRVFSAG